MAEVRHSDKAKKKSDGILDTVIKAVFGGGMVDKAAKGLSERAKKLKEAEKRSGG